ncbi:AraC-like transcriptional regulator QhpR [Hyphomicrobium sp.]|jgi:AraC-like DNA-binding protein|uniref:AraC-like transcriptional regulator QhpR n=1 Tax=Hyphomicrobium sp. TaxID=82 RepID=UPI002C949CDC|nr:AraC family transcriptional regulator [Hyphomicrobium sp.]HVZ04435.1 AraC family transcriptional regulator [Hyphomicrobium sp.]
MGVGVTNITAANAGECTGRDAGPSVLASAATGIVTSIERYKGDVDRIFGHAGISPEMAGSPTLQLSLDAYCRLFEESARQTQNDNFGLWFGNSFDPRDLGLWGYAALSAPTLGAALETLVELFPLHQQSSSMALVKTADGLVRLEYRIDAPQIVERRQDAELSLGMFLNVIRDALGHSWAPEEVHFEHPKPEAWREHERAFAAQAFFSQPTNAIIFRPQVLKFAMPGADPRLMSAMRLCLQRLSQRNDVRFTVADRVRTAVRARLPEGFPPIEAVAAELRMPLSAIQRELHYDGLSYSALVENTRRDLALSYIRQRQLSFSEIAFLVGYSELSAFSRAVRRWTGLSPRALRAQLVSVRV